MVSTNLSDLLRWIALALLAPAAMAPAFADSVLILNSDDVNYSV